MWVIQNAKELHNELEYNAIRISPEQVEQDKIVILELEAELINSICTLYNEIYQETLDHYELSYEPESVSNR